MLTSFGDDTATILFVEDAAVVITRFQVGLVAFDLVELFIVPFATVLDTAVAAFSDEAEIDDEFKVGKIGLPISEIGGLFAWIGCGGLACDSTVLHTPECSVSTPAIQ